MSVEPKSTEILKRLVNSDVYSHLLGSREYLNVYTQEHLTIFFKMIEALLTKKVRSKLRGIFDIKTSVDSVDFTHMELMKMFNVVEKEFSEEQRSDIPLMFRNMMKCVLCAVTNTETPTYAVNNAVLFMQVVDREEEKMRSQLNPFLASTFQPT